MRPKRYLTVCLMSVICGVGAASCATQGVTYPPVELLAVEAKPVPPDDVLTSRIAGEKHDNAVEAWGERGWSIVAAICEGAKVLGADVDCRPRTPPREPG
jgi:hypothetical protein